jgi:hypothetical protein
MKLRQLFLAFLSIILSFCCLGLTNATTTENLTLGGKDWKLGFKDENSNAKVLEYITNDEKIDKWSQLLTLQKLSYRFPKEITPIMFANKEIEMFKAKGLNIEATTIESTPQLAIIELRITSPLDQQQDELQGIIKTTNNQLIVLHYATRPRDMEQAEKSKWVDTFKGFKLPDL